MVSRVQREIKLRRMLMGARAPRLRGKVKAQVPPIAIERAYLTFILQVLALAKDAIRAEITSQLPRLVAESKLDSARTDTPAEARRRFQGLRVSFDRGVVADQRLETSIAEFGRRTEKYQGSQLQEQIRKSVGIEVPLTDPKLGPRLRNWTAENVGLIKSIPGQLLDQVERDVVSGVNNGTRWEVLAKDIEDRFDVTAKRASLIARDQVGKFYGAVQRARQTNLGILSYTWRTSRDERVREGHAEREGETFKWAETPEDVGGGEGHPGQPINCRCTAEPNLEELLDGLEADEAA